jgi:ABC-type glutathione transport system ATPase component
MKIPKIKPLCTETQKDEKMNILATLTLLSYQFEILEFNDNFIFTGALKFAVNNLKKLIEKSIANYYKGDDAQVLDEKMNSLNTAVNVATETMNISYRLSEVSTDHAHEYLKEWTALLHKYNLSENVYHA